MQQDTQEVLKALEVERDTRASIATMRLDLFIAKNQVFLSLLLHVCSCVYMCVCGLCVYMCTCVGVCVCVYLCAASVATMCLDLIIAKTQVFLSLLLHVCACVCMWPV